MSVCVGVCTHGARAMVGKNKAFLAFVRDVVPHVLFTHCMIHREALAAKTLECSATDGYTNCEFYQENQ